VLDLVQNFDAVRDVLAYALLLNLAALLAVGRKLILPASSIVGRSWRAALSALSAM
jgi:hypothetical protein